MKKIDKIALVAGEGDLPVEIARVCQEQQIDTLVLRADYEGNFKFHDQDYFPIDFNNLEKTVHFLKENHFEHLVFAGRVSHTLLFNHYQEVREASKKGCSQGDNSYYSGIIHLAEGLGFKVIGTHEILKNSLATKGAMTLVKPKPEEEKDALLGFEILRKISKYDIGQSIIINNCFVLGLEAIEGTDNLIKRCKEYKSSQRSGVLIKIKKTNQEVRIDLPVIGEHTIKEIHAANLAGIALESEACIIINKNKTIETANELGIFILGI